jgi:uncharacterized protein YrrD
MDKQKSLKSSVEIMGYTLVDSLTGKRIGKCHDFLFDDETWAVHYMTAEIGNWIFPERVVVSPVRLHKPDWENRKFPVLLTKGELKENPLVNEDPPASIIKYNASFVDFLRPYHYQPFMIWGGPVIPVLENLKQDDELHDSFRIYDQGKLRSIKEVIGYKIHLKDQEKGHVEDFILNVETWVVDYLVIDTRDWVPGGKKLLLKPCNIISVSWADGVVSIDHTKESLEERPEVDHLVSGNWQKKRRSNS